MTSLKYTLLIRYTVLLVVAAMLWQCATVTPPTGGDKDETPPQVLIEKSSTNFQTGFEKQPIVIAFDEWIDLKNVRKQVVISPPLDHPYELYIKKKSIVFEFAEEEVLRDSTTYTINFGEAVQDITESNPAKDLRYVFSTGSFIDSLTVKGQLVDALTGKPQENALFMLYENKADSVVRTIKPFYFARSDKDGRFEINNVKNSTFKGFALVDEDNNYKYSQLTEKIGFPTDWVIPTNADSTSRATLPPIAMFKEDLPLQITKVDTARYGYVKCVFNQRPREVNFRVQGLATEPLVEWHNDSLKLWYNQADSSQWTLFVQRDTVLNDTLIINPKKKQRFLTNKKLYVIKKPNSKVYLAGSPVEFKFNHPLQNIDTSLINIYQDTTYTKIEPMVEIDSTTSRQLNFDYAWKTNKIYTVELLPQAITDMYASQNQDTIYHEFIGDDAKQYGNIIVTLDSLDRNMQYLVSLKKKGVVDQFTVSNQTQYKHKFTALKPGNYSVLIQTDINKNGYWDSGSYDHYRMPEPQQTKELEKLRANWDVETTIVVE